MDIQVRDADSQDYTFNETSYELKLRVTHGTLQLRPPASGVTFMKGNTSCTSCREFIMRVRIFIPYACFACALCVHLYI